MRQAPELPPEEQEWQHLADAYALGELDEQGMQRFYDLLRDEQNGSRVAALAWDSLQMRGTLRTALDPHFRSLIADRIEQEADSDDSDDSRGFIGSILAGIGLQRPRLKSVRIDLPQDARPPHLRWFAAACILAAAVVATVIFLRPPSDPLLVDQVSGEVTCVGTAITSGQRIGSSIVQVGADSEIVISWDAGHRARIAGPASFSASPDGLSLIDGYARVHSAATVLTIGLTDRRITVSPDSQIALAADHAAAGLCAVISGASRGERGDQVIHLGPDRWSDGSDSWPWHQRSSWTDQLPTVTGPGWSCGMSLSFTNLDDSARLQRDGVDLLRISGSGIVTADGEQVAFTMPPGKRRTITLTAELADLVLTIDGQPTALLIPGSTAPERLRCDAGVTLHEGWLHNGPPVLAQP